MQHPLLVDLTIVPVGNQSVGSTYSEPEQSFVLIESTPAIEISLVDSYE
jgi:hypothetical protein